MEAYWTDYHRALTLIVAEDPSQLLRSTNGQQSSHAQSLYNIAHRQLRFLAWYYGLIFIEGIWFGYLTRKYGDWSDHRIYQWVARKILLPNVSEWQLLLTDFSFPKRPKRDVFADVLCDDHLYRGKVGDYFLDTSGQLSGIFLKNVERFRRKDYEQACQRQGNVFVQKGIFWTEIPGANFYTPANQITNLNVRFPYRNTLDLQYYLLKALKDNGVDVNVSIEVEQPAGTLHENETGLDATPSI